MKSSVKFSLLLAAVFLSLMALSAARAEDPGCEQGRREIAAAEKSIREVEEYIRKGGPGYPAYQAQLPGLKAMLAQGREEYRQKCGGGQGSGSGGQAEGEAGPQRNPEDDNPFRTPNGNNDPNNPFGKPSGDTGDPNNPFGGKTGSDPNNPFGQKGGPDQKGSLGAAAGSAAGQGSGSGPYGVPVVRKEPPRDFHGKPCGYFTKPSSASYPDGSFVCYQDRMYECIDRYWVARADCGAYDKYFIRRAEEIEKSSINTKIYQDE